MLQIETEPGRNYVTSAGIGGNTADSRRIHLYPLKYYPGTFFFQMKAGSKVHKLARLIIASGEASPDMRYAAGFPTPDEFIYFATERERGVICSPLEFGRAMKQVRQGVEVHSEAEFGGPERIGMLKQLAAVLHVAGYLVPASFPALWLDRLRESGLVVRVEAGAFFPEREFKSRPEVEQVVVSQRAAEAGVRRAFEVLAACDIDQQRMIRWNGELLTSEMLRAEIDIAMVRLGMQPTGTICAGGTQGAQPHNAGSGPLPADRPIVMDIFPRSAATGYWGDLTRTVVKGRAPDLVKRAFDAVLSARELAKSMVGVGADPAEIHNAAACSMERAGFRTGRTGETDFGFFHGLGHGVGLDIHEAPRLSPRNTELLKGGEIVTVEPGLYYPEWGGIRLEDLMFVAPDGPAECLTEVETFLEIS